MYALMLSLLISTAFAQEAEPDAPLASDEASQGDEPPAPPDGINEPLKPIDESLQKPRNPGARKGPPGARRGPPQSNELTPEHLKALRSYQHQSLSIRRETEVTGGGFSQFSTFHTGIGYGGVMVSQHVTSNPVHTTRSWGIYRGPQRIQVLTFLEQVGATERQGQVSEEMDDLKKKSQTRYRVAGIGSVGVFAGIMGMSISTGPNWNTWNMVTLGSSLVTLGGMIGGSIPGSKANQLQRSPSASMTAAEAQEWIDAFNDSLATELGLSAKEAWLLESNEH